LLFQVYIVISDNAKSMDPEIPEFGVALPVDSEPKRYDQLLRDVWSMVIRSVEFSPQELNSRGLAVQSRGQDCQDARRMTRGKTKTIEKRRAVGSPNGGSSVTDRA
jgi:hypothetical protein